MTEIVVSSSWSERLGSLAGRRRELSLVAAVLAIAVVGALAAWTRGSAPVVAPPAQLPFTAPSTASSASPVGFLVHVAGAVHRPGLYELPAGARIADAIEAAGGARNSADLDALNLAEVLSDGAKVLVPQRGAAAASVATPSATATTGAPVNINTADQAALETVPGLGPVKAAAIIGHRAEIGSFTALEQLLDVTGIGPATLEAIGPYVKL